MSGSMYALWQHFNLQVSNSKLQLPMAPKPECFQLEANGCFKRPAEKHKLSVWLGLGPSSVACSPYGPHRNMLTLRAISKHKLDKMLSKASPEPKTRKKSLQVGLQTVVRIT